MKHSLPVTGVCPVCGKDFNVVARTGAAMGTPDANDLLEWQCAACRHRETESRRLADGVEGDWPESRFNADRSERKVL